MTGNGRKPNGKEEMREKEGEDEIATRRGVNREKSGRGLKKNEKKTIWGGRDEEKEVWRRKSREVRGLVVDAESGGKDGVANDSMKFLASR